MKNHKNELLMGKAFPYLMCTPSLLLFTFFVVAPFIIGIYISFFNWNGLGAMKFISFNNYKFATRDPIFWQSMKNTIVYAIVVTLSKNIIGLFLAIIKPPFPAKHLALYDYWELGGWFFLPTSVN